MINKLCGTRPIKPNKRKQNPGWQSQIAGFRRSKFDIGQRQKGGSAGEIDQQPFGNERKITVNSDVHGLESKPTSNPSTYIISIIPHKIRVYERVFGHPKCFFTYICPRSIHPRSAPLSAHSVRSLIVAMATIWDLRRRDE
jgi:hypothetical protein